MKVKFFSNENEQDLEKEINEFLSKNKIEGPGKIQYLQNTSVYGGETKIYYGAMVVYGRNALKQENKQLKEVIEEVRKKVKDLQEKYFRMCVPGSNNDCIELLEIIDKVK